MPDKLQAVFRDGPLGMKIDRVQGESMFTVTSIKPDGQAAAAGVELGFCVVSINGVNVSKTAMKKDIMAMITDAERPFLVEFVESVKSI